MIAYSAATSGTDTEFCIADILRQLTHKGCCDPQFLMVQTSCQHELLPIAGAIRGRWPAAALHLATSCNGSMSDAGLFLSDNAPGICVFALADPQGDYASVGGVFRADVAADAQAITRSALHAADRPGEIPELIWISATPGCEERVIEGIQQVVGPNVPIVGGSAADDTIAGNWRVWVNGVAADSGLIVTVFFPTNKIATAFHSGYKPSNCSGIITCGEGRRITAFDGLPASDVYAQWTRGEITRPEHGSCNILMQSALLPLGRKIGNVEGTPIYLLSHPETINSDGSITLFTEISAGEQCVLMEGHADNLINRPVAVIHAACRSREIPIESVTGIILVFCAGCMLSVKSRVAEIHQAIRAELPGVPFITAFTFGEQGSVLPGKNRHGNLMISAVVFT